MANIALSAGVRTNLLSLQGTASMLTATQEKLATGKKVNSALDNPTNFFTAQALSERATSLTSLQDGVNTGIQTVKAANKGLDTITSLLKQAKSIAEQQKNAVAGGDYRALVGTTALARTGNGLTGDKATAYAAVEANAAASIKDKTLASSVIPAAGGMAVGSTLAFTTTTTATGVTEAFTYTVAAEDTYADMIKKINDSGVVSAKITESGTLEISAAPGKTFTAVGGGGTAPTAAMLGLPDLTPDLMKGSSSSTGQDFVKQFSDVAKAINEAVADSSYNGINLLQGGDSNNLTVTFDGKSKSSVTVASESFTTTDMKVTTLNAGNAKDVLDSIDTAMNKIRGAQGEYGNKLAIMQTRLDFSKELSNMLEVGADNLTLADTNKEAANLLALQTRQSLSQSALSLANQSDQAVLQLLR
jgi:flagellin